MQFVTEAGYTGSVFPRSMISARAAIAVLLSIPTLALGLNGDRYTGMVWETYGNWYLNGSKTPIRLGEAVPPGALLTADAKDGAESTVILLPDGQRLLCACSNAMACSQGFRVPALIDPPAPAAWDIFVGVRNALLLRPVTAHAPFPPVDGRSAFAANQEMVTPLLRPGTISIATALSTLPAGRYKLTVIEDVPTSAMTTTSNQVLAWSPPHGIANIRISGRGVFWIRVVDASSALRMQIAVLVTTEGAFAGELAKLRQTRATVRQWSSALPGWPVHDFLRVYLQSLVLAGK